MNPQTKWEEYRENGTKYWVIRKKNNAERVELEEIWHFSDIWKSFQKKKN